jgi:hypothetical protein
MKIQKIFLVLALFFFALGFSPAQQESAKKEKSLTPRPEHPRPQFFRNSWINLNGKWSYRFDFGVSGKQRGFQKTDQFEGTIAVPFCPESRLSGVEHRDFINALWYQRTITIPESWEGKRIRLHFGAVDYASEAFIDGRSTGKHWGGTCSFDFDITDFIKPGSTTTWWFMLLMMSAPGCSQLENSALITAPGAATIPGPPASGRRFGWRLYLLMDSSPAISFPILTRKN